MVRAMVWRERSMRVEMEAVWEGFRESESATERL
jgi:hypothetical protein